MTSPVLRVLTYHRVMDLAHPDMPRPASVSATPAAFARQMQHLARRFRVVSALEVLSAFRGETMLPRRAVLVTFDDAYHDFAEYAWPVMRRLGLPATVFVPTSFPDSAHGEFWWDRLHRVFRNPARLSVSHHRLGRHSVGTPDERSAVVRKLERLVKAMPHEDAMQMLDDICEQLGDTGTRASRVLGWDALRSLAADGVALAPHTRTHPALSRMSPEHVREEVRGSRIDLERETGSTLPLFSYPYGAHDDTVTSILAEEGIEVAVTCIDGHSQIGSTEPLRLRRTNISRRTTDLVFRARLNPLLAYVDVWRHRNERAHVLGKTL